MYKLLAAFGSQVELDTAKAVHRVSLRLNSKRLGIPSSAERRILMLTSSYCITTERAHMTVWVLLRSSADVTMNLRLLTQI